MIHLVMTHCISHKRENSLGNFMSSNLKKKKKFVFKNNFSLKKKFVFKDNFSFHALFFKLTYRKIFLCPLCIKIYVFS